MQNFETKLKNAKEILEKLSNPELTLENSIKSYEEGMALLFEAQKILEEAAIKIEQIKSNT